MKATAWTILAFGILLIFGNGAFWNWKQNERQEHETIFEDALKLNQLEKEEGEVVHSIFELTKQYIEARDEYSTTQSATVYRRFAGLEQELQVLKQRYANLERVVAKLENRSLRPINLEFTAPGAPRDLRITP
jgi:cell division protein FtsB